MAKKNWIYIKRGLSESPKHRDAMGNRIWLFMHIIDRADWETGIVHEWKDKDESEDMGIPYRTLQQQRQELQDLGYISCQSKGHYLSITIHKWVNPKDYGGKVLNVRGESTENSVVSDENQSTVQTTENTVLSEKQSTVESTVQTTVQPFRDLRTFSSNPMIIDHGSMDEWMKSDSICIFLKSLPGFNSSLLESTRREIVAHHYEQGELSYLWNECQFADNPIGMFTHKVTTGQHSVDWQMLQIQQSEESERAALNAAQRERTEAELERRGSSNQDRPVTEPDESIKHPLKDNWQMTGEMAWQAALGELQLEMTRATFETWVRPAKLLSVNGTWKIGTPDQYAQEWLERRLMSTVKRVLCGIVGQSVNLEFVVMK